MGSRQHCHAQGRKARARSGSRVAAGGACESPAVRFLSRAPRSQPRKRVAGAELALRDRALRVEDGFHPRREHRPVSVEVAVVRFHSLDVAPCLGGCHRPPLCRTRTAAETAAIRSRTTRRAPAPAVSIFPARADKRRYSPKRGVTALRDDDDRGRQVRAGVLTGFSKRFVGHLPGPARVEETSDRPTRAATCVSRVRGPGLVDRWLVAGLAGWRPGPAPRGDVPASEGMTPEYRLLQQPDGRPRRSLRGAPVIPAGASSLTPCGHPNECSM